MDKTNHLLPKYFYDYGLEDNDFKPDQKIRDNAALGLEYRKAAPPSRKGGLTNKQAAKFGIGSGVQRAVTLINDEYISPKTVKRMYSFFSRHSAFKDKHDHKNPNRSYISWLIWGGDKGYEWSQKLVEKMKSAKEEDIKKKRDEKKKRTISEHIDDLVQKYLFEDFSKIKEEKKVFSKIEEIQQDK
jgi:hypothetical protein